MQDECIMSDKPVMPDERIMLDVFIVTGKPLMLEVYKILEEQIMLEVSKFVKLNQNSHYINYPGTVWKGKIRTNSNY